MTRMADQKPKISVRNVGKTFKKQGEMLTVLEEIDLDVAPEEFVAIVGPSGCGKSTLLNCIAGFEKPTSGTIEIDGEPLLGPSPKRVFVFQETGIFPWRNVRENIGFGLRGKSPQERREIVERTIKLVGLEGFGETLPADLSGGMKQRVEFARALAVDSEVLYLDEPFGALDAFTRLEMRREVWRISRATKKTCLLVTHDVEEAVELADRIAVMTRRPAKIRRILENRLPRPRDPDMAEFRAIKDEIFEILGVERRV